MRLPKKSIIAKAASVRTLIPNGDPPTGAQACGERLCRRVVDTSSSCLMELLCQELLLIRLLSASPSTALNS